jgi:hypothetical protein
MNAGVALRQAVARARRLSEPHLRILCHGNHHDNEESGRQEGGYGLLLGITLINFGNVEPAFRIVRNEFQSIVFVACAAGHFATGAKINQRGDGAGMCLKAAAAANAPVFAPERIQQLSVKVGGSVWIYDWEGPVYKYTPPGWTVIVQAS